MEKDHVAPGRAWGHAEGQAIEPGVRGPASHNSIVVIEGDAFTESKQLFHPSSYVISGTASKPAALKTFSSQTL